jgi:hypothetical protein
MQRAAVGVVDLMGVMWLIRRRKKAEPAPDTTVEKGQG